MKRFRTPEFIIILALTITLGVVMAANVKDTVSRDRDATRIADINTIRTALALYHDDKGTYPACLYKKTGCISLEGTSYLLTAPHDPSTNLPYTYAGLAYGGTCSSFHLGTSLERQASQALLTGSDAPPEPATVLCTGSAPDFSGLSYAPGGQPCTAQAGIAQPTNAPNGETCFDLKPRRTK